MAYTGTSVSINLGQGGLHTDDPQAAIPPNAAIKANNISLYTSRLLKSPGSAKYSTTALSAAVVALFDWWPTSASQRLVAVTADGKMWRDTGDGTWGTSTSLGTVEVQKIVFSAVPDAGAVEFKLNAGVASSLAVTSATTAAIMQTNLRTIAALSACVVSGTLATGFLVRMDGTTGDQTMLTTNSNTLTSGGPAVTFTFTEVFKGAASLGSPGPDSCLVAGGAEVAGNNRKLFFFSTATQVKVLNGDGSTIGNIRAPAADWTSFPTQGIMYQGRLHAILGHTVYISRLSDHEDFATTTTGPTGGDAGFYPIFSGEGDGLVAMAVYKGVLLLFKKPFGVYVYDWTDTTAAPIITKFSDTFGIASPHSLVTVLDDMYGLANTNSVFSLKATQAFGSLEAGDVLSSTRVRDCVRNQMTTAGAQYAHSVFYPEKELALFTMRATGSSAQNRMLVIDMSRQQPRSTIETKDQPTCLALRKDSNFVPRPIYGANDGYVYQMDQSARAVGTAAYVGEFQTPYIDFSYLDASLASKAKQFDFLQVTYTSSGNWSFYVDVYIDGNYSETLTFAQLYGAVLGTFRLNVNRLGDLSPRINRRPLHCTGKAISFRIYNSGLNEFFNVERLVVGFRVSGEQDKSSAGGS